MKELMLGNKAFARGLYEAGCKVVSSYPGTPSTEITEEAAKYNEIYCEWAPNEKVAMEVAFGSAMAGKRSFCGMKHVGLNVAADPLFTASYTGVNAGMVIGVADDPGMHSSQNEQDSRHYAISAKIPMLEPSDSSETLEFVKLAYEISEKYDTPVLVKMCTRVSHCQSIVEIGERQEHNKEYMPDSAKYVMMPGNAKKKHPVVEEKMKKLKEFAESTEINKIEMNSDEIGIITSSTSYLYVKEAVGDKASILKLGMINPMPVELIREFSSKVKKVIVIEELDPIIETHCKSIGIEVIGKDLFPKIGEFSQNLISEKLSSNNLISKNLEIEKPYKLDEQLPIRPPAMCSGCPHRGIFYLLAKNKITVMGDIGCYTLGATAPLNSMHLALCMGASISSLHGVNKALGENSEKKTVAVIGDSTFIHSGMTSLANVAYNQSNSTIIILDNSITGMTGHQQIPTTGYNIYGDPAGKINVEELCKAMGINRVFVVDPYDLEGTEKIIKQELNEAEPSVIISRRPCILLKTVKTNKPLCVNTDNCKSCKACLKLGCPAISFKDGKACIDKTLCTGCKVCKGLCKFSAIEEGRE